MTKREIVPRLLAAVWLACVLIGMNYIIPGLAFGLLICACALVAVVATAVSVVILFTGIN